MSRLLTNEVLQRLLHLLRSLQYFSLNRCKRAVDKIVRLIGHEPHTNVFRCVYVDGDGKGKHTLDFKWEYDGHEEIVRIRADKALWGQELSPPKAS